jgi:prevent-host-death family protein
MTMYSGQMTISVAASEFKAKCLGLLDQVSDTGETVVITKRGKPIARLVPLEQPQSLKGSVTFLVSDEELIRPLPERWNAESD